MPTDRDEALTIFSDTFKEIHGFRPHGMWDWTHATADHIAGETQRLIDNEAECKAWARSQKAEEAQRRADAFDASRLTYRPFAGLGV